MERLIDTPLIAKVAIIYYINDGEYHTCSVFWRACIYKEGSTYKPWIAAVLQGQAFVIMQFYVGETTKMPKNQGHITHT